MFGSEHFVTRWGCVRLQELNELVDTERMTGRYIVLEWTNHYRIVRGRTYRDAVARLAGDPTPRLVSFPDGSVAA